MTTTRKNAQQSATTTTPDNDVWKWYRWRRGTMTYDDDELTTHNDIRHAPMHRCTTTTYSDVTWRRKTTDDSNND